MNCPFCAEEIKDEAAVCRHCRRDLSIAKAIYVEIRATGEAMAALKDEVATLRGMIEQLSAAETDLAARQASAGAAPAPQAWSAWSAITSFLIPFALLLLAHYLIVIRWDLDTIELRIASIAIPILSALAHPAAQREGFLWHLGIALPLGVAAVLAMSFIVSTVDHSAVLPQDAREWRELIEYMASVSLSYLTGALVARALRRRAAEADASPAAVALVSSIMKMLDKSFSHVEDLEKKAKSIQSLFNASVPVGAAAGAVFTGVHSLLQ